MSVEPMLAGININCEAAAEQHQSGTVRGTFFDSHLTRLILNMSAFLKTRSGTVLSALLMCAAAVSMALQFPSTGGGVIVQAQDGNYTTALFGVSTGLMLNGPVPTILIGMRRVDSALEFLLRGGNVDWEQSCNAQTKFLFFLGILAQIAIVLVIYSAITYFAGSEGTSVNRWHILLNCPTILVMDLGCFWVLAMFIASSLCSAALSDARKELKTRTAAGLEAAHKGMANVLLDRLPVLTKGWGVFLALMVFFLFQFAVINTVYTALNPGNSVMYIQSAAFGIVILVLIGIPTMVSGECDVCLIDINELGLREPELHEPCQRLEERLTGGLSKASSNRFGFCFFTVRITPTLIWSAATALIGVTAVVLHVVAGSQ